MGVKQRIPKLQRYVRFDGKDPLLSNLDLANFFNGMGLIGSKSRLYCSVRIFAVSSYLISVME